MTTMIGEMSPTGVAHELINNDAAQGAPSKKPSVFVSGNGPRLAISGVDLFRVQTLMGHKSSRMTVRYAHLSPEHLQAAVATLDALGPKPWETESDKWLMSHGPICGPIAGA